MSYLSERLRLDNLSSGADRLAKLSAEIADEDASELPHAGGRPSNRTPFERKQREREYKRKYMREYMRRYSKKPPRSSQTAYHREWRARNREHLRKYRRERYARLKASGELARIEAAKDARARELQTPTPRTTATQCNRSAGSDGLDTPDSSGAVL